MSSFFYRFLVHVFILVCWAMSFSLAAVETKTLCLNMLVKNHEATIRKCVESVKPFITYWVVVDVGSTDNTIRIIRECLKEIPGEVHVHPWKNIEETYNAALRFSKSKADYVLFMSGEAYLEAPPLFQLPPLERDVYCISWNNQQTTGFRRQIIKTSMPWRWKAGHKGELDYLSCDEPCSSEVIEGIRYVLGAPYLSARTTQNTQVEVDLDLKKCQKVFATAESYRTAGDKEQALEWYKKRVELGQNGDDMFLSLLQIARLQQDLGFSANEVIDYYYKAYIYDPTRVEPVYGLAHFYNHEKKHELAYECIKAWGYIPREENKSCFCENEWMEKYGLLLELSICSFYVGRSQEALDICDMLLKMEALPKEIRSRVVVNQSFMLKKIATTKSSANHVP